MENLFLELLNMSITASWLVFAIVIFRWIFKKAPKWLNVMLWALVGIRLICPFSIESVLSLIPSAETIPSDIMYEQEPTIHTGINALNSTINPIISETFAPNPTDSVNPLQVLVFVATYVWLFGILVMVLYTAISYIRLKRKVREAVPIQDRIWMCDRIDTPFILGIIRPNIYLPSSVSQADITYVLAHEKAHMKRRDYWWKPLGFLLLTVYWFNPILWLAYVLLCRDIEFACDEKVLTEMGIEIKKPYSDALINCSVSRRMVAACPLAFSEVGVKERVKSVLNYKKPAFWVIVIAIVVSVIVAIGFLTNPVSDNKENIPQHMVTVCSFAYAGLHMAETTLSAEDAYAMVCVLNANEWKDDFNNQQIWGTFCFDVDGENLVYNETVGMFYNQKKLQSLYLKEEDIIFVNALIEKYLYPDSASAKTIKWFDYYYEDYDKREEGMTYEHKDIPGVQFVYSLDGITAYRGNSVIIEPFGFRPCMNAYFCDLTQDGVPELCLTGCIGSGMIDQRVVVYDCIQGEMYQLEDRSYYDYVLSMVGDTLIVTKLEYRTYEIVEQGQLLLLENEITGEVKLSIASENSTNTSYELFDGIYLAGVEMGMNPSTESYVKWPYFYLDTATQEFRMGQSILMSSAIFGTYEFDGRKLTLYAGDSREGDRYVLYINEYGSFEYNEAESIVTEHQWLKEGMAFGLAPQE